MSMKNSGFTASGISQPEIRPGDIYQDKYGVRITIKSVDEQCITYTRSGYRDECTSSLNRLLRDFTLVRRMTYREWAEDRNALKKTQKLRELINASREGRK
ncbi:TPA: DUF4222 domain-containing protein [Escherichia coli]|nr:DUF4222 domain-containing protein [Escherichia coli]